jgi:hypothetical protein
MSKRCEGGCNRQLDEYYILRGGRVFCYDCWKRATEDNQKRSIEQQMIFQNELNIETQIKNLKSEIEINESSHEYYAYITDEYGNIPKPPIYDETQKLRERRRNLEAQLKRSRLIHFPQVSNYIEGAKYYNKDEAAKKERYDNDLRLEEEVEKLRKQKNKEEKTKKKAMELLKKAMVQNVK